MRPGACASSGRLQARPRARASVGEVAMPVSIGLIAATCSFLPRRPRARPRVTQVLPTLVLVVEMKMIGVCDLVMLGLLGEGFGGV